MYLKKHTTMFGLTIFVTSVTVYLLRIGYNYIFWGKTYAKLQWALHSTLSYFITAILAAFVFYFVTRRTNISLSKSGTLFSAASACVVAKIIVTILVGYRISIPYMYSILVLVLSYAFCLSYSFFDTSNHNKQHPDSAETKKLPMVMRFFIVTLAYAVCFYILAHLSKTVGLQSLDGDWVYFFTIVILWFSCFWITSSKYKWGFSFFIINSLLCLASYALGTLLFIILLIAFDNPGFNLVPG